LALEHDRIKTEIFVNASETSSKRLLCLQSRNAGFTAFVHPGFCRIAACGFAAFAACGFAAFAACRFAAIAA